MLECKLIFTDGVWKWVDPVGCGVGREFSTREDAILWGEEYFDVDLGGYYEDQT